MEESLCPGALEKALEHVVGCQSWHMATGVNARVCVSQRESCASHEPWRNSETHAETTSRARDRDVRWVLQVAGRGSRRLVADRCS
eukprot:543075-Prymnesium_polylepis.1